MVSVSVSRFFFLLPLVLSLSFLSCEAKGNDLITKICERSISKEHCKATLRSQVKSGKIDMKDLAATTIQNLMTSAYATSDQITKLLNTTSDPFIQQCLSDCSEAYIDAVDQLGNGLSSLDNKSYSDVNKALSAAVASVELCEEGFKSEPNHTSVLKDNNLNFKQQSSNALAITKYLAGSTA